MRRAHRSIRRVALLLVGIASAGLLTPAAAFAGGADAPTSAENPSLDTSGLYAFTSPDQPDTVTIVADSWPMQEAGGGPVFYPFTARGSYDINIDQDGDGVADLVYRYVFTTTQTPDSGILYANGPVTSLDDPNLQFRQTYTLTRIQRKPGARTVTTTLLTDVPVAPSDIGPAAMPDYGRLADQAVTALPDGGKSFAGQADDPTFADQRVWDLLYGGNLSEVGQDTYAGRNTNAIALQLPKSALALNGDATRNPVIGVWTTTAAPRRRGTRIGQPLVNDLITPFRDKDRFNVSKPATDGTLLTATLQDPQFPKLIQAVYGVPAPPTPRGDLTETYLTGLCRACGPVQNDLNSQQLNADVTAANTRPAEELRLNTSVAPAAQPNRYGVVGGDLAGYPNGRRLTDDATDITIQILEGALRGGIVAPFASGDGVNTNDQPFRSSFPYLALPNAGNSLPTFNARNNAAETPAPSDPTGLLLLLVLGALLIQPTLGIVRRVRRRT